MFLTPFRGVCLYRPTQSPFWVMWSSEFLIPYVRSSDRCYRRFGSSSCLFPRNLTLKMKSLRSLQTSVIIYQSSRRNILRDFCIQFPINTARILFVVCRNIPVWTQRVWYWSILKCVQFRTVTWGKVWGVVTEGVVTCCCAACGCYGRLNFVALWRN